MPRFRWTVCAVSSLGIIIATATFARAEEPFGATSTQPEASKSSEASAAQLQARGRRECTRRSPSRARGGARREEATVGVATFGVGYGLGALIVVVPALLAGDYPAGPVENAAEKRLALIPVAGPMMWWGVGYGRVHERTRYESLHPCKGPDTGGGCWDTGDIDQFFHVALGLPYAIAASGAQALGIGFMVHAALRSEDPVSTSGAAPKGALFISPTLGGLTVRRTW